MKEYVDVCIVGGGIVGLYTAAELAREGFVVRLIDKHYIGSSRDNIGDITQRGHAPLLDEFVTFCNQSWQESGITMASDLGLMPLGSVEFALNDAEFTYMKNEHEMENLAHVKGFLVEEHSILTDVLGGIKISEHCKGAKLISRDMVLDTRTALNNLRQHLVKSGVRIWGSDVVKEFLMDKTGTVCGVRTDSGDVCLAQTTIVCAGIRASRILAPLGIHIPLRPARCHVLEMTPNGPLPPQVVVQPCENGFLRLRRIANGRVLVSYDGILDPNQSTYSQEVDRDTVEWMRKRIAETLPAMHNATILNEKTVTLAMTPDLAPCLGPYGQKQGILLAVGMNGRSYAYAAGAARVLKTLLIDEPYPTNIGPMEPDRFATGMWEPMDMQTILPSYQAKKPDGETAPAEPATAAAGTPPNAGPKADVPVTPPTKPAQKDVVQTEKEIQQGEKALGEEVGTTEAQRGDVVQTEKEIQQGEKALGGEVGTAEAQRGDVVQMEHDYEDSGKSLGDVIDEEASRQKAIMETGKTLHNNEKDIVDVDSPEAKRAEHVEMVGKETHSHKEGTVSIHETSHKVQTSQMLDNSAFDKNEEKPATPAPAKKEGDKAGMMVSRKGEKVEVSFGMASLVKK